MGKLIAHRDPKVHEELISLLDKQWDTHYKDRMQTIVTYYDNIRGKGWARRPGGPQGPRGRGRGGMDAAHQRGLPEGTEAKCFPTNQLGCPMKERLQQMEVPTSLVHAAQVCTTYERSDGMARVLGETVPFMKIKLASPSFAQFLGIETKLHTEALLKALKHAMEQGDTRLPNIHKLYQWACRLEPRSALARPTSC